jgi:hypothetical protein
MHPSRSPPQVLGTERAALAQALTKKRSSPVFEATVAESCGSTVTKKQKTNILGVEKRALLNDGEGTHFGCTTV